MEKLKYDTLRSKLHELGLQIFTVEDIIQLFPVKRKTAQSFLSYNFRNNKLKRLKKGYYFLPESTPHEFLIANTIYSPSYVSHQSALSFHNIIPEAIYTVTSTTAKKTATFNVNNKDYTYFSIKKEGYTGYQLYELGGTKVKLATPEKALADLIYKHFHEGIAIPDRLYLQSIDNAKLSKYIKLLGGDKLNSFWEKQIYA